MGARPRCDRGQERRRPSPGGHGGGRPGRRPADRRRRRPFSPGRHQRADDPRRAARPRVRRAARPSARGPAGAGHTPGRPRAYVRRLDAHRPRARVGPRPGRRARDGPDRQGVPDLGGREAAGRHPLQQRAPPPAPRPRPRRQQEHGEQGPPGGGSPQALHRPPRAGRPGPGDDLQRPPAHRPGLHVRSGAPRTRPGQPGAGRGDGPLRRRLRGRPPRRRGPGGEQGGRPRHGRRGHTTRPTW